MLSGTISTPRLPKYSRATGINGNGATRSVLDTPDCTPSPSKGVVTGGVITGDTRRSAGVSLAWFGDRPPFSRSHAPRGHAEAPRRGEHQAGVTHSHTRRELNLPATRRYPVRPEDVCSDPCRQLVMGAVSRPEDGDPSRTGTADILSAPGTTDISLALPAIGEDLNAEHVGRVSGPSRGCGRPGVSGPRNPPVVRG